MNRERIERWEHTPTVEARVPWSDTAIAVVCRPFYSHRESMPGCTFSNLYPAEVSIDTTTELRDPGERFLVTPDGTVAFPSTENAFQCAKAQLPLHDHFVRALTPIGAAQAGQGRLRMNGAQRRLFESLGGTPVRVGTGRHKKVLISADRRYPKRPRWDVLKRDVMAIALRAKFDRHPSLWRGHLESDPFTFFIEHTVNDAQWGDGGLGHGTNLLGKMLTALNHELRSGTTIDRHAAAYDAWLSQPNIDVLRGFYD